MLGLGEAATLPLATNRLVPKILALVAPVLEGALAWEDCQESLMDRLEVVDETVLRLGELKVPELASQLHDLLVSAFHSYQEGLERLVESADETELEEAISILEVGDELLLEYEEFCEENLDQPLDFKG